MKRSIPTALKLLLGAPLAAAVGPAPTISIAPGINLPLVTLGTGSGQKGDVANATALWLGETSGVNQKEDTRKRGTRAPNGTI